MRYKLLHYKGLDRFAWLVNMNENGFVISKIFVPNEHPHRGLKYALSQSALHNYRAQSSTTLQTFANATLSRIRKFEIIVLVRSATSIFPVTLIITCE